MGRGMNTDSYSERFLEDKKQKFSSWKLVSIVFTVVIFASLVTVGCGKKTEEAADIQPPVPVEENKTAEVNVPAEDTEVVNTNAMSNQASNMISYDVTTIGRSDPFMPSGELEAFEEAKKSALAEAFEHNAKVAEISKLKNMAIRQPDDISPYSFNLPVPPTSLAPSDAAAAKITRTKVVGIMYNKTSPSAIINVDDKDYLVRQGDKIIGQEYKVMEINPSWITVSLGSNVYSASIGELFSKDEFDKSQNDLYNLRNRFGGRKG